MEHRHHLTFEAYEVGKLTLEEYLSLTVFYEERPFTVVQFRDFMFAQSKPYPEMLELVAQLKVRHGLKIVVVSNEGRELNAYRIRTFKLDGFVDAFIASCLLSTIMAGATMSLSSCPSSATPYGCGKRDCDLDA